MRKHDFCYAKTKVLNSCAITVQIISAFVSAKWRVKILYFSKSEIPSLKTSAFKLSIDRFLLDLVRFCRDSAQMDMHKGG